MVLTKLKREDIISALSNDFINDKQPLIEYAGFEDKTTIRKTFSSILTTTEIDLINEKISPIYQKIIKDISHRSNKDITSINFDYIRFDAFYYPEMDILKIIEINSKNAGLHEICEWLDQKCIEQLQNGETSSLNEKIVINQKFLHDNNLDSYDSILYLSPTEIPRWIYFDKIQKIYSKEIIDNPDMSELVFVDNKLFYKDKEIKAIIGKLAKYSKEFKINLKAAIKAKNVFYVQPRHSRFIGDKTYLQEFNEETIAFSEKFDPGKYEYYCINKDNLVLKIKNKGSSKGVYLGANYDYSDWEIKIYKAMQRPYKWTIQEYLHPPKLEAVFHESNKIEKLPILFGIFVLPKIDNPYDYDIDIVLKAYNGNKEYFKFDPASKMPEISFGNVIITN